MKITLSLLTLFLASLCRLVANPTNLAELSMTLPQLETKAHELNKIKALEYKKFYLDLGKAINTSLSVRKIDDYLFKRLPENVVTRTARYVVQCLIDHTPAYKKSATFETEEGSTIQKEVAKVTIKFEGYKELTNIPLDNITNQIVMISKLVDHIVSHTTENQDIAILSNDIFDSIFYTFFVQGLYHAQYRGKIRFVILGDTLDDADFKSMKEAFENLGQEVILYKTKTELNNNPTRFNMFLFDPNMSYGTKVYNAIKAEHKDHTKGDSLFTLIGAASKLTLAFIPNSMADSEKKALFNHYIHTQLDNKEVKEDDLIKDYHWHKININYLDLAFRIYISADKSKANTPLFVFDKENSEMLAITLPLETWPTIGAIVASATQSQELENSKIYIFNKDYQEFMPIDQSILNKVKTTNITW